MSCTYRWGTAITAALLAAGCAPDEPTAPPAEEEAPVVAQAAQGKPHLIELRGEKTKSFDDAVAALGGKIKRNHRGIGIVSVTGLSDAAAATLAARADVVGVTPDRTLQWIPRQPALEGKVQLTGVTAAPQGTDQTSASFFDFYQWNIRQIQADRAYSRTPGGAGALVCVLDTGVDPNHIDLVDKVDVTASMVAAEPFIEDLNTHGTFVSALISSNGLGMASVAPDARLCAVKVSGQDGSGSFDDLISGIEFASDNGADVINMSLGAYVDTREAKQLIRAVQKAVDYARSKRVLVVASAGNDGIDLDRDPKQFLHIPSQLDHVVSVGATAPFKQRNFDNLASYSNFGRTGLDVVAPGGEFVEKGDKKLRDLILSACSSFVCGDVDFYLLGDGTSFAAPHVSGEGAVIESALPGDQATDDLAECISKTADDVGLARFFGDGRINVYRARKC
jgi:lantibiotic leader peptide-processing serine protease